MSIESAIRVENITVIYNEGTPNEVVALDNVSLNITKGETVILTGGNGSGKSTLIKAIAGIIPIKSGKIFLNGQDVSAWSFHRRAKEIGFVHQDPMLGTCPNLTVHENFQLVSGSHWWSMVPYKLSMTNKQLDLIGRTKLPLEKKAVTNINLLSGGQRQAIALCLAFSKISKIMLFDEFTSALDEKTLNAVMMYTLEESKRINATILMIMHDLKSVRSFNFRTENLLAGRF